MLRTIHRLYTRKHASGTLEKVILLAIALMIAKIIKDKGEAATNSVGGGLTSFTQGAGQ